ncbi:MAG TPA: methyltransferase domain-containing protein, partial [Candidatus Binatia bacterium]
MFDGDTDRDWERWGATDPYYGVLSEEKYRTAALTAERREEFFQSGRAYVARLFDIVRLRLDPDFVPRIALEFGCGVGRLAIPLAAAVEKVVAADAAPSMLDEAR